MSLDQDALTQHLLVEEGERFFAYDDNDGVVIKPGRTLVGKLTIGIGHNLTDDGIMPAVSRYILQLDMAQAEGTLDHYLPWWSTLDPARQLVLADMAFAEGTNLLAFKKMLAAIQAGDWAEAAAELINSDWARTVGTRANKLAQILETGVNA